jgi:hypothetical protein
VQAVWDPHAPNCCPVAADAGFRRRAAIDEAQTAVDATLSEAVQAADGDAAAVRLLPENEYLQKEIELTPEQKQRMREIELQLTRVPSLLMDKEIRKELSITTTQIKRFEKRGLERKEKVKKAAEEWAKLKKERQKEKKRLSREDREMLRNTGEKIDAEFDEAILNELTRLQQEKLRKLKGEPIDPGKIFNRKTLLQTDVAGFRVLDRLTSPSLASQPFEKSSSTPKIFGIVPDLEYLQKELKLTAGQKKRMREIEIQLTRAFTVLIAKDVRKALSISDEQLGNKISGQFDKHAERLQGIVNERRALKKKYERLRAQNAGLDELRMVVAEMRQLSDKDKPSNSDLEAGVLGELTEKQRKEFIKLQGKPVDPAKIFNRPAGTKPKRTDL